jgi:hypothetical protein
VRPEVPEDADDGPLLDPMVHDQMRVHRLQVLRESLSLDVDPLDLDGELGDALHQGDLEVHPLVVRVHDPAEPRLHSDLAGRDDEVAPEEHDQRGQDHGRAEQLAEEIPDHPPSFRCDRRRDPLEELRELIVVLIPSHALPLRAARCGPCRTP